MATCLANTKAASLAVMLVQLKSESKVRCGDTFRECKKDNVGDYRKGIELIKKMICVLHKICKALNGYCNNDNVSMREHAAT